MIRPEAHVLVEVESGGAGEIERAFACATELAVEPERRRAGGEAEDAGRPLRQLVEEEPRRHGGDRRRVALDDDFHLGKGAQFCSRPGDAKCNPRGYFAVRSGISLDLLTDPDGRQPVLRWLDLDCPPGAISRHQTGDCPPKMFGRIWGNATGEMAKTVPSFAPVVFSVFSARSRALATALSQTSSCKSFSVERPS